ncbi:MAG TPA: hypothetical protein VM406_15740 [Noviherbaspirillum sp.]|nr:hypothetical protein [Noviherbaspirillum sp.]
MPVDVPYSSQWSDPTWTRAIVEEQADPCEDPSWTVRGFSNRDEYRFWARRTCGLACLESMLGYWRLPAPDRANLLRSALARKVYEVSEDGTVRGLIYRPFADWLQEDHGLRVEVLGEVTLGQLLAKIPGEGFGMASVSPRIRYPTEPCASPGGHLVLIISSNADEVIFHNPSGIPPYQSHARVRRSDFERFFANRGMVISRPRG